jgi:hypothetical protein
MGRLNPSFRMICQRRRNWCWAAVSSAVQQYPPPNPANSQCAIAGAILPGNLRCCDAPDSCDLEFSLRETLDGLDKLLLFVDNQVTFDVIQDQIDVRNRPVCARIEWDLDGDGSPDGAHFVVIVGCRKRGPKGVPLVSVMDPDGGDAGFAGPVDSDVHEMPLKEFQRRYRMMGTWRQTYLVK